MKKLNLKQPKYIFPLVIFLPLTFAVYEFANAFGGGRTSSVVATDSLNMSLPDAQTKEMKDKMAMSAGMAGEAYTAVDGLGDNEEDGDTVDNGYSESEMNAIDRQNAERSAQELQRKELERSLVESSRHINSYQNSSSGGGSSYGSSRRARSNPRREELDDYARELEYIQSRSRAAQNAIDRNTNSSYYDYNVGYDEYGRQRTDGANGNRGGSAISGQAANSKKDKPEVKPEIVRKVGNKNSDKFNTVSANESLDAPLIRAMIDKTTKAHEGTRLRFKLLDDVTIKNVLLKKGTYLYGLVTGFGNQRVRAQITSILIRNKFIRVNLSVYDNDGMEGFYVPESAFRDMMKEAGAQALGQNMSFDNGYGSALTGESVALQAIQNAYQSVTGAVSANIRKNRAKIKYNTVVYLVNTEASY